MSKKLTSKEKRDLYKKSLGMLNKTEGARVIKKFDETYQIVVELDSGDIVDYYASTGTFKFRNSNIKGNGITNLLSYIRADNIKFKDPMVEADKFIIKGNGKDRVFKADNGNEYLIKGKEQTGSDKMTGFHSRDYSVSSKPSKIGFIERLAIKFLTKKNYVVVKVEK